MSSDADSLLTALLEARSSNQRKGISQAIVRSVIQGVSLTPSALESTVPLILDRLQQHKSNYQIHILTKLLDRCLISDRSHVQLVSPALLRYALLNISSSVKIVRMNSTALLMQVARLAGAGTVYKILVPIAAHFDKQCSHAACLCLGLSTRVCGFQILLDMAKAAASVGPNSPMAYGPVAAALSLRHAIRVSSHSEVMSVLERIVELLSQGQSALLTHSLIDARIAAADCVAQLATCVFPQGSSFMAPLIPVVLRLYQAQRKVAFLRAAAAICSLLTPATGSGVHCPEVAAQVIRLLPTAQGPFACSLYDCIEFLCRAADAPQEIFPKLIEAFTAKDVVAQTRDGRLGRLTRCARALVNRCGNAQFVMSLVPTLTSSVTDTPEGRRMVIRLLSVASEYGDVSAFWRGATIAQTESLWEQESTLTLTPPALFRAAQAVLTVSLKACADMAQNKPTNGWQFLSRGEALKVCTSLLISTYEAVPDVANRLAAAFLHEVATLCQQTNDGLQAVGCILGASISPALARMKRADALGSLARVFFTAIHNAGPQLLPVVVMALEASVVSQLEAPLELDIGAVEPSPSELVLSLLPVLHLSAAQAALPYLGPLLSALARRAPGCQPSSEWLRSSVQLVQLLDAPRYIQRLAGIKCLGDMARAAGPLDVVSHLLDSLRSSERSLRVSATIALGAIAKEVGPEFVIPLVISDYTNQAELTVRTGSLRALSFIIQHARCSIVPIARFIVPALTDAFIERDPIHRQCAAICAGHLVLAAHGALSPEAPLLATHFLNLLWPNILESAPMLIGAVLTSLDAMRAGMGASAFIGYVLPGLFHPARHVREAYWTIWSSTYIQAPDELALAFPPVESTVDADYDDWLLDL